MSHATLKTDCSYCETELDRREALSPTSDDDYCSSEHYFQHRGEKVINQIQSDHTFCSSCFAKRKTIDKPTDSFLQRIGYENGFETKQAVVGFEYHTPAVEKDHGFVYCKCGNIDHHAEIEELRNSDLKDVLVNLWSLLVDYHEKDQFGDNEPDREVLFNTLKESDMDFELAIGKSVYSD